jgi:exopolyphosphatase/pppGpp-phosphohydrolase
VATTHARFAVLDLGSTTFQLLVADADAEGSLTPVLRDRVVLNLGRVLAGKGRIPDEVAERAAGTARRLTRLRGPHGSRSRRPDRDERTPGQPRSRGA